MAIFNTARPANGWNLAAFPGGVAKCGVGSAAGQFRPGRCPLQSARQRNDACTVHVKSFSISPLLSLTHSLTHEHQAQCSRKNKFILIVNPSLHVAQTQHGCPSSTCTRLVGCWWCGGVRAHLRVRGVRGQEVGHRCFD